MSYASLPPVAWTWKSFYTGWSGRVCILACKPQQEISELMNIIKDVRCGPVMNTPWTMILHQLNGGRASMLCIQACVFCT